MADRTRINQRPNPLQQAERTAEIAGRALIDAVPFVNQDDEGYLNIKRLAARQPTGRDYLIEQDGHTFNVVQAHAPDCALNRGGLECSCTPSACAARVDPLELPHLSSRTGLAPDTKMPNIPKK
jgi:hypothetical protein